MAFKEKPDLLQFERGLYATGLLHLAGVDEAGRGSLAGPVFAAAVMLPAGVSLPEVDDSKKLAPLKRERLFWEIIEVAISWSVSMVSTVEIDRINIHHASLRAMQQAVEGLRPAPEFLLVDGRFALSLKLPQSPLIDGDARSQTVAAASILAKVSRDRWMVAVAKKFPDYGFERHKGYGTARHLLAIRKHGLTPIHRKTFRSF